MSYASQDRAVAESVCLAMRASGHTVFFDRDDLPPGEEFHRRIREAIRRAHLFVFLLSPDAVDAGSYTLNELEIARDRWKHPTRRILPVILRPTGMDLVPPYLRSVTLFEPEGDIPAAVSTAVHRMAQARRRARIRIAAGSLAAIAGLSAGMFWLASNRQPAREINTPDGARAVLVPAGAFTMGDDENTPVRELFLDGFYIDKHEVTITRYAAFLEANGGLNPPELWDEATSADSRELPVIGVDWHQAADYCSWADGRLPTEAEWEKAARGSDRRLFPWGDSQPDSTRARFQWPLGEPYKDGVAPVGSHPAGASPFGALDLAGNVSEWVADWYSESFPRAEIRNPAGPDSGTGKVIRGGSWYEPPDRLMTTRRFFASPDSRFDDTGFRCARGLQR